MPLAKPGMLWADITRSVFMFTAAGGEIIVIVQLMSLCHKWPLVITGGMPEVTPIIQVELKDFDFDGNHHDDV